MSKLALSPPKGRLSICLVLGVVMFLGASPAWARLVQGPSITYEAAGRSSRSDSLSPERQRLNVGLIAPMPAPIARGLFAFNVNLDRTFVAPPRSEREPPVALPRQGTLALGAIYYPHFKEGAPRYFLAANRFARPTWSSAGIPLTEFEVGANIADVDMPWSIAPAVNDQAAVHVSLRSRHAAGVWRVEPAVGYQLHRSNGFFLDLLAPRHLLFGWKSTEESWRIYLGSRRSERPEAAGPGEDAGWILHHDTSIFAGGRLRLWHPVYATLEAGNVRRSFRAYSRQGKPLASQQDAYGPLAVLSLAVWLGTP